MLISTNERGTFKCESKRNRIRLKTFRNQSKKTTFSPPKADIAARKRFEENIKTYPDFHRQIIYLDESGFAHDMPRKQGYAPIGTRGIGKPNWHLGVVSMLLVLGWSRACSRSVGLRVPSMPIPFRLGWHKSCCLNCLLTVSSLWIMRPFTNVPIFGNFLNQPDRYSNICPLTHQI